jgi:hypothetical protein
MNNTSGCQRRRRAGPRRAGVLAAIAGIAVLVTACSSGGSSAPTTGSTGGSTTYQKALAYSQCVRSHGVPNFPDPNSNGVIVMPAGSGGSQNLNSPQAQSANKACQHLLPNGGRISQAQQQQDLSQMLKFARCMRSHGLPNFPDPTTAGGGVSLNLRGSGIDKRSPLFQSAQKACQSQLPGRPGGAGQAVAP